MSIEIITLIVSLLAAALAAILEVLEDADIGPSV